MFEKKKALVLDEQIINCINTTIFKVILDTSQNISEVD
jgi:hypothetical protein